MVMLKKGKALLCWLYHSSIILPSVSSFNNPVVAFHRSCSVCTNDNDGPTFLKLRSSTENYQHKNEKINIRNENDYHLDDEQKQMPHLEALGAAGLSTFELKKTLQAISNAAVEYGFPFTTQSLHFQSESLSTRTMHNPHFHSIEEVKSDPSFHVHGDNDSKSDLEGMHGINGRVILLSLNNVDSDWTWDDDRLEPIQEMILNELDHVMYSLHNENHDDSDLPLQHDHDGKGDEFKVENEVAFLQPILVSIRPIKSRTQQILADERRKNLSQAISWMMRKVIFQEIKRYDLCKPLVLDQELQLDSVQSELYEDEHKSPFSSTTLAIKRPIHHVQIDGAMIMNQSSNNQVWDTSSIYIFDDLVDDSLRRGLLDVILGKKDITDEAQWDDVKNGPNPNRWVRGGLDDIPQESDDDSTSLVTTSCWGLTEEAIDDLCGSSYEAIQEFERRLSSLLSDFIVCRLPEAVLGSCVSPLTANAPTANDSFSYHIDADPNATPPSPWTDIYGRYPNRINGKPRFMSCLIYLNDVWDASFGAPTRFLDPPTQETYDVIPKPGRCILMDQDITHTVIPPTSEHAGENRPRYSLVWKLILHPRKEGQRMNLFAGVEQEDTSGNYSFKVGSANTL